LAQYILQKAGKDRISVTFDMTQNDLSDYFGVARPSVARTLGEMEEEGFIIAKRKNIKILDRKGLSDLIFD
jgi:CRP-like cAMP-binding protein